MATLVCETVTAARTADLRRARDNAAGADMVELRLDGVTDLDVAGALEGRSRPVIVTCRPSWEGGRFDGAEDERLRILGEAIRLGAEFVDVEWKADRRSLPRGERTRIVLSHHDVDGTPADLCDRVRAMRAERADVLKVAVTARRLSDCLTLREAVRGGGSLVAIAMGTAGQLTRVCPWLFGSCWTYTGAAAPGQFRTRDVLDTYRVNRTSTATAIYAVAGAPLGHSASPHMHNPAFASAGIDAVYVPLETADAEEFDTVARQIGLRGASVTAPLKQSLLARGVAPDALAARIGAINTVRRQDDAWEGRNFDAAGFLAPIERRRIDLKDVRAVVLGAGGAARAAVWALASERAHVEIAARRSDAAARLAREFDVQTTTWPPPSGWDVLVNTTPIGTWPDTDAAPIDAPHLQGRLVYDLVYNPIETTLLANARRAGIETISGLEMLVAQACRQFEWWIGRDAPAATIERGALEFLSSPDARVRGGTRSPGRSKS